jgi:hypothetical protein
MSVLAAYVDGIGVLGPGLPDWPATARVLRAEDSWQSVPTVLPAPQRLPSAERRRTGTPVKLALAVGLEATAAAGVDASLLPAVFSSSGGDGQNCHEICQVLASADRQLSPTRFHNSVHNAAAGYWGIATGATPASNALCAHDASFAAGLLEALCQVAAEQRAVLFVSHDSGYPEPLRSARPIPDAFAVALLLAPHAADHSRARVCATTGHAAATSLEHEGLEKLRTEIPAARCLPLLARLARGEAAAVTLDYLEDLRLTVEVTPCR